MAKKNYNKKNRELLSLENPIIEQTEGNSLLSIVPEVKEAPIEETKISEDSVFNAVVEGVKEEIKEEIVNKEEPVTDSVFLQNEVVEEPIVNETEKKEQFFEEVAKQIDKKQFYLITFVENDKEINLITELAPVIEDKIVTIKESFQKKTLREVIGNSKKVEISYKGESFPIKTVSLIQSGLLIKMIEEKQWMKTAKEKAERLFNATVLAEYRNFTAKVAPKKPVTVNKPKSEFETI